MRIVDNRKKQLHFRELKLGDTFIFENVLCVRMALFTDVKQNQYNAFDLVNSELRYCDLDDMVEKVESTLEML